MRKFPFKNLMYYCGLTRDEYNDVKSLVMQHNEQTLRITSVFVAIMGIVFLAVNIMLGTDVVFPYVFLLASGVISAALVRIPKKSDTVILVLCYFTMTMVLIYATLLSVDPSHKDIPATSIIVFLSLLPLTIDDRPIRMTVFVVVFSLIYLVCSFMGKTADAFELDAMNTLSFMIMGLSLYCVICRRNVRELYQGVRVGKLQQNIITTLATVIEERDETTGGHIQRTRDHVGMLLDKMKETGIYTDGLTEEYCDNVRRAAPMHDIGKIKISDQLLNKPGRLTPEEYEIMKKHSAYGADIIKRTMWDTDEDYLRTAYNLTLYHHERWDGTGYPEGLAGEAIPLEARIMALADVYDALISERPYKKAFSEDEARRIIAEGRGSQFDPYLTDLFLEGLSKTELNK